MFKRQVYNTWLPSTRVLLFRRTTRDVFVDSGGLMLTAIQTVNIRDARTGGVLRSIRRLKETRLDCRLAYFIL